MDDAKDIQALEYLLGDARPAYRALTSNQPVPQAMPRAPRRLRLVGGAALSVAAVLALVALMPGGAPTSPARSAGASVLSIPGLSRTPVTLRPTTPATLRAPRLRQVAATMPSGLPILPRRPRPDAG